MFEPAFPDRVSGVGPAFLISIFLFFGDQVSLESMDNFGLEPRLLPDQLSASLAKKVLFAGSVVCVFGPSMGEPCSRSCFGTTVKMVLHQRCALYFVLSCGGCYEPSQSIQCLWADEMITRPACCCTLPNGDATLINKCIGFSALHLVFSALHRKVKRSMVVASHSLSLQ